MPRTSVSCHDFHEKSTVQADSGEGWNALVTGGTGAIGKYLVAELLCNDSFAAVTVIGRREIEFGLDKMPTLSQFRKLRYVYLTDLSGIDSLQPSQLNPSQYHAAFCCLGTTRKDAGSPDAFRKLDLDCVSYFGNLAKKVQVVHVQLVTSMRANKDSFFMYAKTKGEVEEVYRSLCFKHLTIIRPFLLDRASDARLVEKIVKYLLPTQRVQDVARAMVRQAELVLRDRKAGEEILQCRELQELSRLD